MSLQACPFEILHDIVSLVHPDHYLSLALVCKKLFSATHHLLKERHKFKHIFIGNIASCQHTRANCASQELGLNIDRANYRTPLELISDIALQRTEVAEFCARSLTFNEPLPVETSQSPIRHQDLVSDFIFKVIKQFPCWRYHAGLFQKWHWHDEIMALNHDAAFAFLLLLFPNLHYVSLDRQHMQTEYVDCLIRIACRSSSPPFSNVLRQLRELRHASTDWDAEEVVYWAELPAVKEIFVTHLPTRFNPNHSLDPTESNLVRLTVAHGELGVDSFLCLIHGVGGLKYLSYHCSVEYAVNHRWECSKFFAAIRAKLQHTLEHLDFGLGTETLDPYFRGWCGSLVDFTRLKDLTVDCNMLYRPRTGPGQPCLASALLDTNDRLDSDNSMPLRERLLPSCIEKFTMRDQKSDLQSPDEYLKAHSAFSKDFLAGDPGVIRQTYPCLETIYNLVDIEEELMTNLKDVGIDFRNRSYFWE
ncbi:hypothetical protein MMC10_009644 [Thelotrema lepadinum]|nr:hypothetical protein [Thelotrema lepadinum]